MYNSHVFYLHVLQIWTRGRTWRLEIISITYGCTQYVGVHYLPAYTIPLGVTLGCPQGTPFDHRSWTQPNGDKLILEMRFDLLGFIPSSDDHEIRHEIETREHCELSMILEASCPIACIRGRMGTSVTNLVSRHHVDMMECSRQANLSFGTWKTLPI